MDQDKNKVPTSPTLTDGRENENLSEQRKIRRDKLKDLRAAGLDPYLIEKWDVDSYSLDIKENFDEMEGKSVSVAGRIMQKRLMGKAAFFDIQDKQGRIQCYVRRDDIGKDAYKWFKTYDIGDIVGLEGKIFKTKTGEISVHTDRMVLLTKSLQVLPDKWSGLRDEDLRYRQRYVDLIMNEDVRKTFYKRADIIKEFRRVLEEDYGFLEVDTPILTTVAGGANARPFLTHHNTLNMDMKLRISNELYLKRLIVGGLDRVYEMGKMFRNEGMDRNHNPEFTNMECYMAYGNMESVMDVTEQLLYKSAMRVNGSPVINYQGKEFDLTPPWKVIDMTEAVKECSGVDFSKIDTDEEARQAAIEKGMEESQVQGETRGKIIADMFEEFCEDKPGYLDGPLFVVGHPVEVSPLAKRDPKDNRITRRFEAYINGWEVANAFSELNDPIDQYERFYEQQKQLDLGIDDEAHPMDKDFVNALEVGMPPTGGLGVGVDRVVMLICDCPSIRDAVLFPTMKPLGDDAKRKSTRTVAQASEKQAVSGQDELDLDLSKVKIEPLFEDMVSFDEFSKNDLRVVKILNCEDIPKSRNLLKFTLDDGSGNDRIILSGIKDYYSPEELIGKTCLAIVNMPAKKMMGIDSNGMLLSSVYEYEGEERLQLVMLSDNIPAGAKIY